MRLKLIEDSNDFKKEIIFKFEKFSRSNPNLFKLVYETSQIDSIFFVGGFLRSIINGYSPRDLDMILNSSKDELLKLLNKYKIDFDVNKMGGFKLKFGKNKVDIWTSDINWAFKENLIKIGNTHIIDKIAEGTFFNYDSLVYDIKLNKLNVSHYNNCVKNNELDIIKKRSNYKFSNPGRIANVVRVISIKQETNLNLSHSLCKYIDDQFKISGAYDINDKVDIIMFNANRNARFKKIVDREYIISFIIFIDEKLRFFGDKGSAQITLW